MSTPSINAQIITALSGIGIPVVEGEYEGDAEQYIVFWCDAIPTHFADNAPQYDRWIIEADYIAPHTVNTVSTCSTIRSALFAAGFTYPSQQRTKVNTGKGELLCTVFEFEKAEAVT